MNLIQNEPVYSLTLREPVCQIVFMLPSPQYWVRGDTNVQRAAAIAGKSVDAGRLHLPSTSFCIQAFAGMTGSGGHVRYLGDFAILLDSSFRRNGGPLESMSFSLGEFTINLDSGIRRNDGVY